jgi:hypothetical protein
MLESAAEQELDGVVANVGYYRGSDLVYVSRVRNGFVPATRRKVGSEQEFVEAQ